MLATFAVENFGSLRDVAELDMRTLGRFPAGAQPWDGALQTVAAVYGANASGKSTLFRAFHHFRVLVESSYRYGRVEAEPFALDEESASEPTRMTATFIAGDGVCYSYGFGIMDGKVVHEFAEQYRTARATLLFERENEEFRFGAALTGQKRSVQNTVSPSTLFLSAAAAANYAPLMPLFNWVHDGLRCYSAGGYRSIFGQVFEHLERDPDARRRVSALLREADLGLAGMHLERRPLTEGELALERQRNAILRDLDGIDRALPDDVVEASFQHRTHSGTRTLRFDQQSAGTQAMLCHAFALDQALTTGRTVVFDEIDASLHPLLVASIVRAFKDRETNPHQAQFIFTTHDVSLIEPSSPQGAAITREEMWVTEKDYEGASHLVPVIDFSPRADHNLRRRYLVGRYGGIPENIDFSFLSGV